MFYLNVNIIDSSTLPQKLVVKTKNIYQICLRDYSSLLIV